MCCQENLLLPWFLRGLVVLHFLSHPVHLLALSINMQLKHMAASQGYTVHLHQLLTHTHTHRSMHEAIINANSCKITLIVMSPMCLVVRCGQVVSDGGCCYMGWGFKPQRQQ
jgi:hypothetical protein